MTVKKISQKNLSTSPRSKVGISFYSTPILLPGSTSRFELELDT